MPFPFIHIDLSYLEIFHILYHNGLFLKSLNQDVVLHYMLKMADKQYLYIRGGVGLFTASAADDTGWQGGNRYQRGDKVGWIKSCLKLWGGAG